MDVTTKLLGVITLLAVLAWIGPGALLMNLARGTALRHAALWLAVIVALMIVYRFVPRY